MIGYWFLSRLVCLHSFQRVAESTSVSSTAAGKYYNKRTLTSHCNLVSRSTMYMEIAIRNAVLPAINTSVPCARSASHSR